MTERKFGSLSSSQNPEKLSLTIQALIGAIASVLVAFFGDKIPFTEGQVNEVVGQLGIAISSIFVVVGVLRKGVKPLGKAIERTLQK